MREKSLAIVATYLRTRIIDFMSSYTSLYMHICVCRELKHSVIILRALHVDTAAKKCTYWFHCLQKNRFLIDMLGSEDVP